MNIYTVTIKETLEKVVEVKANSKSEAEEIVNDEWNNSEHVLDADSFKDVTFIARQKEKSKGYER